MSTRRIHVMSALEAWKQRVAAHREQSHKIRSAMGAGQDLLGALLLFFKADPHRTDDVEVNRLARGDARNNAARRGGRRWRFALPLALRCKHVTVVEPSPSMGETLRHLAAEAGIENITLVASPWHAAEVEPADVVLSAHVIYSIEDIGPFVMKLAAHARQRCACPHASAARPLRPILARCMVRTNKNSRAAELMQVLWELDIRLRIWGCAPIPFRPFKDWQRALDTLRPRLFVTPDTEHDAWQHAAQLLIETSAGYVIKGAQLGVWRSSPGDRVDATALAVTVSPISTIVSGTLVRGWLRYQRCAGCHSRRVPGAGHGTGARSGYSGAARRAHRGGILCVPQYRSAPAAAAQSRAQKPSQWPQHSRRHLPPAQTSRATSGWLETTWSTRAVAVNGMRSLKACSNT